MANWKKTELGELDDSEMPFLKMPKTKYQIVFGEGCDTFMIGPALLSNENKNGKNIDVITTTSLADNDGTPLRNFISRLLDSDSKGRHRPRTIRSLLAELDPAAMYGVHGVDDNPRLHPYAAVEKFCSPCKSHTQCGGAGNQCTSISEGEGKRCTAGCTTDEACPSGFVCSQSVSKVFPGVCTPEEGLCE